MQTIRFVSFLAAATCITAESIGQVGWIRQSFFPIDRTPKGVFAQSPTHAFFVGSDQLILQTTNSGATWNVRSVGDWNADPYYAVTFPSPTVGIITGNNTALRSTDGGLTWNPVANFPAGSWSHLDFIDSTRGFAGANGALVSTIDAGASWQLQSGYPTCPVIYGMDFRDANVGLVGGDAVGGDGTGIFKTSDGGKTWTKKANGAANDVVWMSSTRAIADFGTTIRHSVDSGETWTTIAFGIESGFVSMNRLGQTQSVVGASGKGDVWRSTDGGFSWTQTFDGPGDLPGIWELSFSDEQNGWMVGPGGFYYQTHDGGQTWMQRNSASISQIEDIQMLDSNFGFGVGTNGYVYRTDNGGDFWSVQKLEVTGQIFGRDEGLRAIDIVNAQVAVAAGPGGTVFKTTNGGQSWVSIGYPKLSGLLWIHDVDFIDANVGYVYGIDQDLGHKRTLFKTVDGGASWNWVDLGERGGGTTLQFVDLQHGWLTADNAFGLRTVDGGTTWIDMFMPTHFTGPEVSKVRFLDANIGWAAGWDGYVAKTSNGGATWTKLDLGTTTDHIFDVAPVSPTEVWLCGREDGSFAGVIYHTVNAGQSWTREVVSDWFYFPWRITALPNGDAWFGGYNGAISRRQTPSQILNPTSFSLDPGTVESGGLASLFASDNAYLVINPAPILSKTVDPIQLTMNFTSPTSNPTSLAVLTEARANPGRHQMTVEVWNYQLDRWENIREAFASATDVGYDVPVPAPLARFVEPSTRSVKVRLKWRPDLVIPRKWTVSVDLARLRVGQ